jgi:hypothetical protein
MNRYQPRSPALATSGGTWWLSAARCAVPGRGHRSRWLPPRSCRCGAASRPSRARRPSGASRCTRRPRRAGKPPPARRTGGRRCPWLLPSCPLPRCETGWRAGARPPCAGGMAPLPGSGGSCRARYGTSAGVPGPGGAAAGVPEGTGVPDRADGEGGTDRPWRARGGTRLGGPGGRRIESAGRRPPLLGTQRRYSQSAWHARFRADRARKYNRFHNVAGQRLKRGSKTGTTRPASQRRRVGDYLESGVGGVPACW